jgi:hypothetical protein
MPVLGIIASGVGLQFDSDYELITTTVLTGNTASVTFSNLGDYSSTYKHLQVRMIARSNAAQPDDGATGIQLNADTGNNYASHLLTGSGSSVTSEAFTSQAFMFSQFIPAAQATANAFGASIIDFLDSFSTTKNKTIRYLNGGNRIRLGSGVSLSTSSITSIKIDVRAGNSYVAGSRFSLYGIK